MYYIHVYIICNAKRVVYCSALVSARAAHLALDVWYICDGKACHKNDFSGTKLFSLEQAFPPLAYTIILLATTFGVVFVARKFSLFCLAVIIFLLLVNIVRALCGSHLCGVFDCMLLRCDRTYKCKQNSNDFFFWWQNNLKREEGENNRSRK